MSELPANDPLLDDFDNTVFEVPSIDGYVIQHCLGQGAFGRVFKAIDTSLSTPVAIKVLNPIASQRQDLRQRFDREIKAYYSVRDSRIIQPRSHGLITQGAFRGCPFVVMEYMDGGSFESWLIDHPANNVCALRVAVEILIQVCEGLSHLHDSKIVHRDLKPANILLAGVAENSDGTPYPKQVRIADFGLAAFLDQSRDLSKTGMGAGTPAYMSPEQFADGKNITPASDQYAIGVILYQLLCSRRPWQSSAEEPEVPGILEAKALSKVPAPPPKSGSSKIDKQLKKICLRCLEPKPEDRYRDMHELAGDLQKWIRGEPIVEPGHPIKWFYHRKVAQPIKRHPGRVFFFMIPIFIAGAFVSLKLYQRALEDVRAQKLAAGERETEKYYERATTEIEINNNLVEGTLWYAQAARVAFEVGSDKETLLTRLATAWSRELPMISIPTELKIEKIALSPDGMLIAAIDKDAHVRVFDTISGQEIFNHKKHSSPPYELRFSEDGSLLASMGENIFISDVRARTVLFGPFEGPRKQQNKKVWISNDGRRVAEIQGWETTIWTCEPVKIDQSTKGGYGAELSRNGEMIALSEMRDTLRILNVKTEEIIAENLGSGVDPTSTIFNSTGTLLASGGYTGEVWVWDIPSGREIFKSEKQDGKVEGIAFLEGGKRLRVLVSLILRPNKGTMRREDRDFFLADQIWNVKSGRLEAEQLHRPVSLSSLSHNGEFLATVDEFGLIRIWKRTSIEEQIAEFAQPSLLRSIKLSQDGKKLFLFNLDGQLGVLNLSNRSIVQTIELQRNSPRYTSISNTEKWIATFDENSSTLFIIDIKSGKTVFMDLSKPVNTTNFVWNRDDTKLLVLDLSGKCTLLDLSTKPISSMAISESQKVSKVSFDIRNNRFAIACENGDLNFYDGATGKDTGVTMKTGKLISEMRFSGIENKVLLGYHWDSGYAELWDTTEMRADFQLKNYRKFIEYSPDYKRFVCDDHGDLCIYDASNGELVVGPIAAPHASNIFFSTDGSTLIATCRGDDKHGGQLMMWDSASGRLVGLPIPHSLGLGDSGVDSNTGIFLLGSVLGNNRREWSKYSSVWENGYVKPKSNARSILKELCFRTGLMIDGGKIRRLSLEEWRRSSTVIPSDRALGNELQNGN